jgi:peptidoglycan/LPS O-acetylase OafA/YrhL
MLHNLQILRAFAALNVVYFHIIKGAESYGQPVVLFAFLDGWGANGIDIFFVISGFVMVYTQSVREKKALIFLANRVVRIVPIYWFLTMFLLFLYFVYPSGFRELRPDKMSTLYSLFFLSGATGNGSPLLYLGWTLEYEMLFYALFCVGIFLGKENVQILFPSVILGLLAITGTVQLIAFEFILGMLCAKIYLSGVLKRLAVPALLVAISWFVTTIFFRFDIDRLFLYGVPSFFLVFGLVHIIQSKNVFLSFLGDSSYSIYLVQVFTIPIFYKISSHITPAFNADVLSILALIASGGIGCLVYLLIEKPMIHYLKGMTIFRP